MKSLTNIVNENLDKGFFSLSSDEQYIISEMATIGYFSEIKNSGKPSGTEFKVFVNGDEGRIPHMHIWDTATNGKIFHTCLKLERPEYFNHGTKNSVLTKKQARALMDFLYSQDYEEDVPIWKVLVRTWNRGNPANRFPQTTGVPDYMNLFN